MSENQTTPPEPQDRTLPPANTRAAAAARRQKAAREGRDTTLPTAPNTGLVLR